MTHVIAKGIKFTSKSYREIDNKTQEYRSYLYHTGELTEDQVNFESLRYWSTLVAENKGKEENDDRVS